MIAERMCQGSKASVQHLIPLRFPPEHLVLRILHSLLSGFRLDLFSGLDEHWSLALWLQFLLVQIFFLAQKKNRPLPLVPPTCRLLQSSTIFIEGKGKRERKRKTYPSKPNKFANFPPLLLDTQTLTPCDGAWVMPRPLTRCPLVVKDSNLVELLIREQPKVEERRGERRMHLAARELHQGGQWQGHLSELGVEGWVFACPS